jgi:carboxyl-terminal processing protease
MSKPVRHSQSYMNRSLILLSICLSFLIPVCAQNVETVKQISQAEPFRLESGVSFSASVPPSAQLTTERRGSVTDDVAEAIEIINKSYAGAKKTETSKLIHNAVDGMLQTLDPHSAFFDKGEYAELLDEENSEYYGIGATIANFKRDGKIETYVLATSPGSAAARAGLRFGDRIEEVDGEDVSEASSDIVRDKVRGPAGSQVRVVVERAASGKLDKITLTRGRVPYATVSDAYLLRPGVGYIDLTEGFNFTTSAEFGRALVELRKNGMESLIVDVRGNPGGVLDQAVKIAEKFLPAGDVIVTQKGRSRADNRVWRSANANPEKAAVVLLVDRDSASASEVVAGALQDHDRAMIVGEKTFGKGLVQSVMDLPAGAGLTLTTARYFTPSGRSIQRDYSDGSLYAYFNRQAGGDPSKFKAAETDSRRKVYGGDGITPDEVVGGQLYTRDQSDLLDPTFFFVREALYGQHKSINGTTVGPVSDSVGQGKRLSAEFAVYFKQRGGWELNSESLDRESDFIAARINYYLALARSGSGQARREDLKHDPAIARAIDLLPRAAELARAARRTVRAANQK